MPFSNSAIDQLECNDESHAEIMRKKHPFRRVIDVIYAGGEEVVGHCLGKLARPIDFTMLCPSGSLNFNLLGLGNRDRRYTSLITIRISH